jgi:hypothetical protein
LDRSLPACGLLVTASKKVIPVAESNKSSESGEQQSGLKKHVRQMLQKLRAWRNGEDPGAVRSVNAKTDRDENGS